MSVYKQLIIRYIHGLSIELNIPHEKLLYKIIEIKSVTESINLNISTKKDDFDG